MTSRNIFLFFLALFATRILFLLLSPLELSPDEAYYWDWSRRLALCYYSKPPMVAWLIALSSSIAGASEIGVRLPAAFLGTGTALFLFFLGRDMADDNAGLWSAIIFCSTLGAALSSYIMTIDAPLLFFWSGAMFFFWKAVNGFIEKRRTILLYWCLAGLFLGFGILSKQTAFAMSITTILFLLVFRNTRAIFKTTGFWIFISIQFLSFFPIIYWNMGHDWIMFSHTAHHFEQGKGLLNNGIRLDTFIELVGSQMGIITPLLFILLVIASVCAVKKAISTAQLPLSYLLIVGAVPLFGVLLLSFKQRVNANWPAPFYLSLSILIALWYRKVFQCKHPALERSKKLVPAGCILGCLLVVILYVLPFGIELFGIAGKPYDPTVRLRGWKELAKEVDALMDEISSRKKLFVVARRRQTTSELAFYLKGQPVVYRWNGPNGRIKSQYEIWPGPLHLIGHDAILIFEADKGLNGIDNCFKKFVFLKEITIPLGNGRSRRFRAYLGISLAKWRRIEGIATIHEGILGWNKVSLNQG